MTHREAILEAIREAATPGQRLMVAIAGPPGAGKSTFVEWLHGALGDRAAVVPMDGFHLENDVLRARGLLHRKGAPQTFDHAGFIALVRQIRAGGGAISFPLFDRAADCTLPDADSLDADVEIVIFAGNYLLLHHPDWAALAALWDVTIRLDVDADVLERRLVGRWLDHGLTPEAARARANDNDLLNARMVTRDSRQADWVLRSGDTGGDT